MSVRGGFVVAKIRIFSQISRIRPKYFCYPAIVCKDSGREVAGCCPAPYPAIVMQKGATLTNRIAPQTKIQASLLALLLK